jgi:hypothetical protein
MKRLSRIFTLFLAALAGSAGATTFIEQPFPTLVQNAENIVRGRIGGGHSDFATSDDGSRRIYTFYELKVAEIFKGSVSGANVLMRELGGEKDGVGMQVPGAAHFQPDEDVVVFLGPRNADGSHDLRGMMMAKFNVRKDEQGREYLVGPGISSNPGGIVHPEDAAAGQGDTAVKKWTLEALRDVIRGQGQAPDPKRDVKTLAPPAAPTPRVESKPSPDPVAPTATRLAAPQLQPSPPVEEAEASGSIPSWAWIIGLCGVLAAALAFLFSKPRR